MAACSICLEDLNDPSQTIKKLTTCPHAFHTDCIDNWILTQGHSRCPDCRVNVSQAQFPGLVVENVADPVLQAQLRQAEELSRAAGGGGGEDPDLAAALAASRETLGANNARRAAFPRGGAGGSEDQEMAAAIAASIAASAPVVNGWACSTCSFVNNEMMPYCEMCRTPRGAGGSSSSSSSSSRAAGHGGAGGGGGGNNNLQRALNESMTWKCPVCDYNNEMRYSKCQMCNSERGGSSSERKSRRRRKQRGGSQKMHNVLAKLTNNRQKIKNMKNNTLRLLKIHANSTRRKSSNRSRR